MNFKKMLPAAFALASLAIGSAASAATITFNPDASTVEVGSTFQVTLVGRDFVEGDGGTYGGGVSLFWDPSILSLVSYDTSVFGGDQVLAESNTTTTIDNTNGALRNLSVSSLFTGVDTADFNIALLTFMAAGGGTTALSSSIGLFNGGLPNIWTDGGEGLTALDVQFGTGSVSAVPLPAGGWLLISGIAGLVGAARRRRSAVAAA